MPRDYDLSLVQAAASRFWSHVDTSQGESACWPWTAWRNDDGYGKMRVGTRYALSHRLAYMLACGPIPSGLHVCHNCPTGDNPACCNPAHLWLGTQAENIADMIKKGRDRKAHGDRNGSRLHPESLRRGERGTKAVLTEEQVRAIRATYAPGAGPCLAQQYGVTRGAIYHIVHRRNWKAVEGQDSP